MDSIARPSPTDNPAKIHFTSLSEAQLLLSEGAHLVLLKGWRVFDDSRDGLAPNATWYNFIHKPARSFNAIKKHLELGGLLGLIPQSLGMIVIDVDIPKKDKIQFATEPHTLAEKKADLFCNGSGLTPLARVVSNSGGIHMFFLCPDGLPYELVKPGGWAFQRRDGKARPESDGDIRYTGGYVALWQGAKQLCRFLRNPKMMKPMNKVILSHYRHQALQQYYVDRDKAYQQGFFPNRKTELMYTEDSWIIEVDKITPIESGRHDMIGTAIRSLISHRAHSRRVLARLKLKFEECMELGAPRPIDREFERLYTDALGYFESAYKKKYRSSFRELRNKPEFIPGKTPNLESFVQELLTPVFGDVDGRKMGR